MPYVPSYAVDAPERAEIDATPGPLLLEFGIDACPYCQRAQPGIEGALAGVPTLRHIKVEDGPGRRLGRSYRIKLWPTLIFLRDGQEIARLVRPTTQAEVAEALARLGA